MDRICETSTTTGTGNFTLSGAVPGYLRFQDVLSSTSTFYYLIEAVDGNGVPTGLWETGIGTLTSATILQRTIILDDSSNGGTAINFLAGTKRVHLSAVGYQLQAKGFRAVRSSNLTGQNFTTSTAIAWNNTGGDFDTMAPYSGSLGSLHDGTTNNTRITIPVGLEQVACRFLGQVALQNITASEWVELKFRVDGSTIIGRQTCASPSTTPTYQVQSPLYSLGSTQYVEMMIQVQTDTSVDILSANSFFQLEVLQ